MDDDQDPPLLAYCVVANVAGETAQGEGGLDIRAGLKHFAPGAKVWVLPAQWGDGGESVMVVGRHRGRGGPYIRMVIPRRHLMNYRVRGVYSPAVLRALTKQLKGCDYGPRLWVTLDEAQSAARSWGQRQLDARFDDDWSSAEVPNPPPIDFEHKGKTYYLAHFNSYRALYSSLPPPVENPQADGA